MLVSRAHPAITVISCNVWSAAACADSAVALCTQACLAYRPVTKLNGVPARSVQWVTKPSTVSL